MADADESDREKPWKGMQHFNKNDVNGKLYITLSNGMYVDNTNLKASMKNKIRRMAAISNPIFYKHQAIGTSNYDTPRWIYLGKDHLSGYIQIPRGLQNELLERVRQILIMKSKMSVSREEILMRNFRLMKLRQEDYGKEKV